MAFLPRDLHTDVILHNFTETLFQVTVKEMYFKWPFLQLKVLAAG